MDEKLSKEELSKKISEVSNINDPEIIDKVINLCLTYRHQRTLDIKNDIGVITKIAEMLFLIFKISQYGRHLELNENYILLANHYKNYHDALKLQITSSFDIEDPLWIKAGHLKAVEQYFYNSSIYHEDIILTEESILHDILRLNLIHGTTTPDTPQNIASLLEKTNQNISDFLHNKLSDPSERSYFKEFENLIYMPEYYELTLNIHNQICLNGAPISSTKTQSFSNADKIIDTIFKNDNTGKFFSFNIKTNKTISSYFNHIGLVSEYRAVFFPNSRFSIDKIFFKSLVKRSEITDPQIIAKFDAFLKENNIPATKLPEDAPELDLSDIPF